MKNTIWDITFIVFTAVFLVLLSETGNIELVQKIPFVTISVAYLIGRIIGQKNSKNQKIGIDEEEQPETVK